MEIVFNEFRDRFLSFVGGLGPALGAAFLDFLGIENRLENRGIFGDVTDPEFWIWGRRSTSDLVPLKK